MKIVEKKQFYDDDNNLVRETESIVDGNLVRECETKWKWKDGKLLWEREYEGGGCAKTRSTGRGRE